MNCEISNKLIYNLPKYILKYAYELANRNIKNLLRWSQYIFLFCSTVIKIKNVPSNYITENKKDISLLYLGYLRP